MTRFKKWYHAKYQEIPSSLQQRHISVFDFVKEPAYQAFTDLRWMLFRWFRVVSVVSNGTPCKRVQSQVLIKRKEKPLILDS